jgi:predicted nucleotidyltransferase
MRTKARAVSEWLLPKARREVLGLLLVNPERRWHLREIVRRTNCALGTVRRELEGLTSTGILIRSKDGNRVYFQANTALPTYPELRGLMVKTTGLADVLREALRPLASRITAAFVYGSMASGESGPQSDVDVMVVGRARFGDVVSALRPAEEKLNREINPTIYPSGEFRRKLASGHDFLRHVVEGPKVFLFGGEGELER